MNIESPVAATATSYITDEMKSDLDAVIKAIPPSQLVSPDHQVPGMDPEVSCDPYTHFKSLRDRMGEVLEYRDGMYGDVSVYNVFGHDLSKPNFCVLGYDLIRQMCMDKESFINREAYGMHTKAQSDFPLVNEMDGDDHRLTRGLFDREVFSKQHMIDFSDQTISPMADFLTKRIAAKLEAGEAAELCRDLALPLLYSSMARIVGVPLVDLTYFVDMGERAFGASRDPQAAYAAVQELAAFFTEKYHERKAGGDLDSGDLMSMMAKAERNGRSFSDAEIIAYCRFLLPGGIETTWRQTANVCYAMMTNPDAYAEVVADPSLIPAAIEEACRWLASGFVVPRIAARDTELGGVAIPAGSSMVGIFGVANRDERIWDRPDDFDLHRARKAHLTFSVGSHICMGQHLARQSLAGALTAMVNNLPGMKLACEPADIQLTGFQIRCPERVPVTAA
ncbi:MAG: cytochrome P450 [Alphaproteobacteria bacterium]